jgi:hypothetical protein
VLSDSFWRHEFGASSNALQKSLTLEGRPFDIVGVTPPEFFGVEVGRTFDIAIPVCTDPLIRGENARLDGRSDWWLSLIGRL